MEALFPILLFAAVYFLMIRPQQQRVKRQRAMVQSLTLGDRVVTVGGILGTIVSLDDERVSLRVADGVIIEALRGAVGQRLEDSADDGAAAEPDVDAGGSTGPGPDTPPFTASADDDSPAG